MGMAVTTITGEVSGEGRGALEGMEEKLPHQCWEGCPLWRSFQGTSASWHKAVPNVPGSWTERDVRSNSFRPSGDQKRHAHPERSDFPISLTFEKIRSIFLFHERKPLLDTE